MGGKSNILCYYVTGHGLGHATRSVEVIERLIDVKYEDQPLVYVERVNIVSSSNEAFFRKQLGPKRMSRCSFFRRVLDSGAVQSDAIRVDPLAR